MSERVKIFVGTDPFMRKAEKALEYSVKKTASVPVDIVWMDYSRGGIWANWEIGRPRRQPYSGHGWGTDFTCFRYAIPEANSFQGRAIYMDVDMILLRDIKELFDYPMEKPVLIPKHWDVILYDTSAFKEFDWWPSLSEMKKSGWQMNHYIKLLAEHGVVSTTLPEIWNCRDGLGFDPEKTGLIHYTDMNTQPWEPYPERFNYPPHPRPDMVKLWWDLYKEAESLDR